MSQTRRYYGHDGTQSAIVHQARRRDSTIGASGRPDPKWLRVGDIVYVPQPPASSPEHSTEAFFALHREESVTLRS